MSYRVFYPLVSGPSRINAVKCVTDDVLENRIHHGWSVEIGKSQPEGPSVPVGNEARRVSHWNDGPEG